VSTACQKLGIAEPAGDFLRGFGGSGGEDLSVGGSVYSAVFRSAIPRIVMDLIGSFSISGHAGNQIVLELLRLFVFSRCLALEATGEPR
jgi:hypothetical protein